MNKVIQKDRNKVFGIPGGIIDVKLKKEIIKQRRTLLTRSMITEAQNKKMSDWTIPKMKEKAKKAEMERRK